MTRSEREYLTRWTINTAITAELVQNGKQWTEIFTIPGERQAFLQGVHYTLGMLGIDADEEIRRYITQKRMEKEAAAYDRL